MKVFDRNAYWAERGKTYAKEERLESQFYRDQENLFLFAVAREKPRSVLDVGCGFGRVTKVLARNLPDAQFLGVDLSADQVAAAIRYCLPLENVHFKQMDVCGGLLDLGKFDVAVCAELLLHLPADAVGELIPKLLDHAKVVFHEVDTSLTKEGPVAEHCYYHNFREIYANLGLRYSYNSVLGQTLIGVREWGKW